MGFLDDAKDLAETTGRKIKDGFEDAKDRVEDRFDEMKADAKVKQAEAEKESVERRNEVKEQLRGDE